MKYHHLVLLCCAFISIFCTRAAYSDVTVTISTRQDANPKVIQFTPKHSLELNCNSSDTSEKISWEKNGKPLTEMKDRVEFKDNRIELKELSERDGGNYTCSVMVEGVKYSDSVDLVANSGSTSTKVGVRVSKNTNAVEGEKLTLKCEVRGKLSLRWWYTNTTSGEDAVEVTESDERFKLKTYYDEETKANITNGELIIEEVTMGSRGDYLCMGTSIIDGSTYNMTSTVRVKDKYAALWPFLGICVEVFVLCAIIFIYEKKRNKTELEESDTDQSPDQKNTPDHGKESNLRHRQ